MKGGHSGSSFSTQESYSIFVDDLPGLADKEWFLNLLSSLVWLRTYISSKVRRSKSCPFAFV